MVPELPEEIPRCPSGKSRSGRPPPLSRARVFDSWQLAEVAEAFRPPEYGNLKVSATVNCEAIG